jgi:DNA-binding GntR family transcriptional regulator
MTANFSEALPKALLSDQVYAMVRGLVLDGSLQPGTRIVESEIARQLGVSQAPVREAIKRLAYEGLVSNVPRRGSYIARISEAEARDGREVRALLEESAAREAVENLDADAKQALEKLVDGMREAARVNDLAAFRSHDMAFHRTVIELSGNSYLPRLWAVMESSLLSLRLVGDPGFTGSWTEMAEAHQALVDALASGNRGRAAAAFHRHASGGEGT